MRSDVKLGIVFSTVVVLVAGSYFVYRDRRAEPIPLAQATDTDRRQGNRQTSTAGRSSKRDAARSASPNRKGQTADDRGKSSQAKSGGKRFGRLAVGRNKAGKPATRPATKSVVPPVGSDARPTRPATTAGAKTRPISGEPNTTPPQRVATTEAVPVAKLADAPKLASNQPRGVTKDAGVKPSDGNRPVSTVKPATRAASASQPKRTEKKEEVGVSAAVETHRVQAGDSFASLAREYYGSERYTSLLIAANPRIGDPRRLRVGGVVTIPPRSTATGPPTSTPADGKADRSGAARSLTYTVKPGDSFFAIARKMLGDSARWEELYALNRTTVGADPHKLKVGQVLTLPAS